MRSKDRAVGNRSERGFAGGRLELKGVPGDEQGVFTGYGALFGVPHQTSAWQLPSDWTDIFVAGAFKRTLAEHKKLGTLPALVLQHNIDTPIGAYRSMQEDSKGLLVEGVLALKTEDGSETYELMKVGGLRGLSVGFKPTKAEFDEKKKLRTILDTDLYEISPVTIGAVPGALVTDVKAMTGDEVNQISVGLHLVMGMAQQFSDACDDCRAGDDTCDHKGMIDKCQSLLDYLNEGKSLKVDLYNVRDFEAVLRDAGYSRKEAKAIIAAGYKSVLPRDVEADGLKAAIEKLTQELKPKQ